MSYDRSKPISISNNVWGWNVADSKRNPNEKTLACPKCNSTDCTLSVEYPVYGTGPNGRGRAGDYGSKDYVRCNSCGFKSYDQRHIKASLT